MNLNVNNRTQSYSTQNTNKQISFGVTTPTITKAISQRSEELAGKGVNPATKILLYLAKLQKAKNNKQINTAGEGMNFYAKLIHNDSYLATKANKTVKA